MHDQPDNYSPDVNPSTGLPMIEDTYLDVGGNPFGTDMDSWQATYDPGYYTPPPDFDCW